MLTSQEQNQNLVFWGALALGLEQRAQAKKPQPLSNSRFSGKFQGDDHFHDLIFLLESKDNMQPNIHINSYLRCLDILRMGKTTEWHFSKDSKNPYTTGI